jgi:hypothetical protein
MKDGWVNKSLFKDIYEGLTTRATFKTSDLGMLGSLSEADDAVPKAAAQSDSDDGRRRVAERAALTPAATRGASRDAPDGAAGR